MSLVGSFVGGLGKKKDDKEGAPEEEKKGSEENKDAGGKAGDDSKSRYSFFNAIGLNLMYFLGFLVRSEL